MSQDQNEPATLESKVWYRFIKTSYWIGWFFIILFTIIFFVNAIPKKELILDDSYITCPNGSTFYLNYTNGYYNADDEQLNSEDNRIAFRNCNLLNSKNPFEDLIPREANPPYRINWVTTKITLGDWISAFFYTFLFLLISSILLDTIRNIAVYISYGQKFSYKIIDGVKKLFYLFN